MLAPTLHLLQAARDASPTYGVLAFNVIGMEHASAIVEGAEAEGVPVILQISQNTVRYWNGLVAPIARACVAFAEQASVPVAVHLDHATEDGVCHEAVECGVSSIMFDASARSVEENIRRTAAMVAWAHERGVSIEGEIGVVGGKDGVSSSTETYTDPREAMDFVAATGVDTLAIAIGTEHGMVEQRSILDLERLDALAASVNVPLVLHGSSGVPHDVIPDLVRRGITKINVATQLNAGYTRALRGTLEDQPTITDPRIYGAAGRAAISRIVRQYCRLVHPSRMGTG